MNDAIKSYSSKIEIHIDAYGYFDGDVTVFGKPDGIFSGYLGTGKDMYSAFREMEKAKMNTINLEHRRSEELRLWKPFEKGVWPALGGKWFSVYGIKVEFRRIHGKGEGLRIPFTKIYVTITNLWRIYKKQYKNKK